MTATSAWAGEEVADMKAAAMANAKEDFRLKVFIGYSVDSRGCV
jgi:hypothetical protein